MLAYSCNRVQLKPCTPVPGYWEDCCNSRSVLFSVPSQQIIKQFWNFNFKVKKKQKKTTIASRWWGNYWEIVAAFEAQTPVGSPGSSHSTAVFELLPRSLLKPICHQFPQSWPPSLRHCHQKWQHPLAPGCFCTLLLFVGRRCSLTNGKCCASLECVSRASSQLEKNSRAIFDKGEQQLRQW